MAKMHNFWYEVVTNYIDQEKFIIWTMLQANFSYRYMHEGKENFWSMKTQETRTPDTLC